MNKEQLIKAKNWDNRVSRPGFFQSKQIVCEALTQKIFLTKKISIFDKNNIWVNKIALYDNDFTYKLHKEYFPKAFLENKNWPLDIIKKLDKFTKEKISLVKIFQNKDWDKASKKELIKYFKKYVGLLKDIEKYYAFAVPLTNFCEEILKNNANDLLSHAHQYKTLDVDLMNESLYLIKKTNEIDNNKFEKLVTKHLKKFSWIKTNYNIVEEYTKEEVLKEIQSELHLGKNIKAPRSPFKHILVGLQVGIYLRNRMKELSQEIWFTYDRLADKLSKDLGINKNDFLQLHYKEVLKSLALGTLTVDKKVIKNRHEGFVVGFLDGKEVEILGKSVNLLSEYFNKVDTNDITSIKGTIACKGFITAKVKNILSIKDAERLETGDVLVTSMTTPDFIVMMKKAGAIVTDEGGLSCHAAIVSRELKIPCIIGTKIATKVLKDGDLVEVDANSGIVKILNKK